MASTLPDAVAHEENQQEVHGVGLRIVRPYLRWAEGVSNESRVTKDKTSTEVLEEEGVKVVPGNEVTSGSDIHDINQVAGTENLGSGTAPSDLVGESQITSPQDTSLPDVLPSIEIQDPVYVSEPTAQTEPFQASAAPQEESQRDTSMVDAPEEARESNDSLHETGSILEPGQSTSTPSIVALSVDSEEPDRRDDDTDSALDDGSIYTTSTSVRSSVYQFVEENGRTYHRYREGKYYLPNDEMEKDRLDLQHHLFLLTLDGELYNAPIKDLPGGLHNVLDIATGTGIWAIEFAQQFPSAHVIGTDLSPIQPEYTPANLHFEVDDAEDPWLFSHQFDYIHGRALATCFKDHQPVVDSAFKFTRTGGYFELQDCIVPFVAIDDSLTGTHLETWTNLIMKGTAVMGKDWTRVRHYKKYFEKAGFVDVEERKYEWPVGTWAKGKRNKLLGTWYREDLLSGLQGFTMAVLTRALGMSVQEVEVLLVGVRDDIRSNKCHVYIPVRVVWGRKP